MRDAIRELGMVGIVEIRRNKGAVVREFDRDELAQIYAVRAELEGMAVELAADRHSTGEPLGDRARFGRPDFAVWIGGGAGCVLTMIALNTLAICTMYFKASANQASVLDRNSPAAP